MQFNDSIVLTTTPAIRTLKIEAIGDFYKGLIKPRIRVMGYWLERAGFKPGNHVQITCVAPGVLELRSIESASNERKPLQPNCSF